MERSSTKHGPREVFQMTKSSNEQQILTRRNTRERKSIQTNCKKIVLLSGSIYTLLLCCFYCSRCYRNDRMFSFFLFFLLLLLLLLLLCCDNTLLSLSIRATIQVENNNNIREQREREREKAKETHGKEFEKIISSYS